jgi:hypothetical protein
MIIYSPSSSVGSILNPSILKRPVAELTSQNINKVKRAVSINSRANRVLGGLVSSSVSSTGTACGGGVGVGVDDPSNSIVGLLYHVKNVIEL